MRALLLLASLALATPSKSAPPPAPRPPAPEVPVGFVARPVIVLADGTKTAAGTAFFTEVAGQRVALMAHHLFGPAGGLPEQLTPEQLPTAVKQVWLSEAWTHGEYAPMSPPLKVVGAEPLAKAGSKDVAVMVQPAGLGTARFIPSAARPLAAKNPKVGDPVWVAAALIDGPEADAHAHAATVVQVDASWLIYEYATPGLNLVATSGAPVLDKDGAVVGLNLGGGTQEGKLYGSANPVDALRPMVEAAVGAR